MQNRSGRNDRFGFFLYGIFAYDNSIAGYAAFVYVEDNAVVFKRVIIRDRTFVSHDACSGRDYNKKERLRRLLHNLSKFK